MNTEKMIRYYSKVVADNRKAYGEDWRTAKYQGVLDRILELEDKQDLTAEEELFMRCRETMAEAFGKGEQ
ncbi:hypothetical protein PSET11_03044 [Arthrobacter ulcerisalmonis]|uniref:Uncharacterized protein n=1 Tax=Arthrobacter ulcerisalmonis TaxID=2483813 RepID=A0A3P5XTC1_9MICC|nr:hypothetical protein [Arthrobacter ulcerisalmonis]VDC32287.1 hypothetical protein PSET11_03044 [Arthrobacter ulcerisalmonis]